MAAKSSIGVLRCLRIRTPYTLSQGSVGSQPSATRIACYSTAFIASRRLAPSAASSPSTASRTPIACSVRTQTRSHTTPAPAAFPVYDYNQVKELSESTESSPPSSPSSTSSATSTTQSRTMLIDVREPHEYNAGYIPSAKNLPVSSQPDALFLDPEDFLDKFDFPKPDPNDDDLKMVFYCKAGVRSSAAAQIARQAGYGKEGMVVEYRGSWNDWVAKGGKVERP